MSAQICAFAEGKGTETPAAAPKSEVTAVAPDGVFPEIDVTVQSGIRWSPTTENIIRAAKARTGKTRRALVEEAITKVWGVDTYVSTRSAQWLNRTPGWISAPLEPTGSRDVERNS